MSQIHNEWLMRRFRRIGAEMFERNIEHFYTPHPDSDVGKAYVHSASTFSRLPRRPPGRRALSFKHAHVV